MDRLKAIFDRQKELMEKYHDIEAASGLMQTNDCPVDINSKFGQARIKDFAWRLTEEVAEALDARYIKGEYREELIDGLHFLTELTILVGRDYNTISDFFEPTGAEGDYLEMFIQDGKEITGNLSSKVMTFIKELGMMCNCLKNKPWKQTFVPTNQTQFYHKLEKVWIMYFAIMLEAGLDGVDITHTYLGKAQTNQQRQENNY